MIFFVVPNFSTQSFFTIGEIFMRSLCGPGIMKFRNFGVILITDQNPVQRFNQKSNFIFWNMLFWRFSLRMLICSLLWTKSSKQQNTKVKFDFWLNLCTGFWSEINFTQKNSEFHNPWSTERPHQDFVYSKNFLNKVWSRSKKSVFSKKNLRV